ncbi:MAG TPA: hypothetical protein VNY53_15310 [Bradyrhizobium sp.]|jgi:hypothetical protein|nr:hypothetical protein [Bradyrhizobium sp.]
MRNLERDGLAMIRKSGFDDLAHSPVRGRYLTNFNDTGPRAGGPSSGLG